MAIRNSISDALPQLRAAEAALHLRADALGIEYRIADFGGVRTQADTALILGYRAADYAAAIARDPSVAFIPINVWRPIAAFGTSFHNYGAAFDVLVTGTPSGTTATQALAQLKALAPSVGLRSNVPNDPPHFELPISIEQARALFGAPKLIDTTTAAISGAFVLAVIAAIALANKKKRR